MYLHLMEQAYDCTRTDGGVCESMEIDKGTVAHHASESVKREERYNEHKKANEQPKGYWPEVLRKGKASVPNVVHH